jgi:hypothetical protein
MHKLKMPRMWKHNDKRRITEEITKERWNDGTME